MSNINELKMYKLFLSLGILLPTLLFGQVSGLVINEFMAFNDACCVDEHAEFDDWLEIYNNSPGPIDLANFFLTDDFNNPMRQ